MHAKHPARRRNERGPKQADKEEHAPSAPAEECAIGRTVIFFAVIHAVHDFKENDDGDGKGGGGVAAGIAELLAAVDGRDVGVHHVRPRLVIRQFHEANAGLVDGVKGQEIKELLSGTEDESDSHEHQMLLAAAKLGKHVHEFLEALGQVILPFSDAVLRDRVLKQSLLPESFEPNDACQNQDSPD